MEHRDLGLELVELRRRLKRLSDEARRNEETWKRCQQREMQLLEAESLVDLLERMVGGLRHSHGLDMVTLALVDPEYEIRRFKRVNDRFGHLAGDRLLRSVARCIEAQIRASDVSARYGGEEFILLLPNTPLDSGRRLAERVRRAVSAIPFDVGPDEPLAVTVSIGAAEHRAWPQRFDSTRAAERLIARADCALYEAKAEGRNRVAEASLAP